MGEEVTVEEALDVLVEDDDNDLVRSEEHDLPDLSFRAYNVEDVPYLGGLFSREKVQSYEKWQVDEAMRDVQTAYETWAEDKGYDIDADVEVFSRPIHEDLVSYVHGSIDTGDSELRYQFSGLWRSRATKQPTANTSNPGKALRGVVRGFDRGMEEDYTELKALTDAVLSGHGRRG